MSASPDFVRGLAAFLIILAVLVKGGVATAQVVESSVSDGGAVQRIEFAIEWPSSLRAQADSLGIKSLTAAGFAALANGLAAVSENVYLSSKNAPAVIVRSVGFDEIQIPLAADSVLQSVVGPPVEVVGIGMFRKKIIGSVQVRLVEYDAERGVLRRYRRIVVEVADNGAAVARKVSSRARVQRVTESVLATGTIFKLPIAEDGVYRVTRQLLIELGLQPDTIDPDRVRIFSNGGAPLPAPNATPRIDDHAELPVTVVGGGDGSFGASDAVSFFAQGPTGWNYDSTAAGWKHYVNPFDTRSFVFVKVGSESSLRLDAPGQNPVVADAVLAQSTGRMFVDPDEFIWSKEHGSGLTWVSNPIQVSGRLDILSNAVLPGLLPGTINISGVVAISSNPITSVRFTRSGQTLATVRAALGVSSRSDQPTAAETPFSFSTVHDGGPLSLQMTVVDQINAPTAALDYLRIEYPRSSIAQNGMLRLDTEGAVGVVEHRLSGFSAMPVVLDVTDQGSIQRLDVWQAGSDYRTQAVAQAGVPRKLVAYIPASASALSGDDAEPVPNQNLHGITSYPDLVIFSPGELVSEAADFAAYRRNDGLDVVVVEMEQLYNEFSGGLVDMRATRDYLKFLYDRSTSDETLLRYALFFGDGHFDFRGLRQEVSQTPNFIPPYETVETFDPDASYTSDDYFGLLDDTEGEWRYRGYQVASTERIDIGVGRFPVKSPEEAQHLVDKIKRYENPQTYGPWRSRYTYVADDAYNGSSGSTDEGDLHMYNMDSVAEYVKDNVFDDIDLRKIYADSYERIFLTEARIPGAREAILNAIDEGTLVVNYSGHGGPSGLAQEDLFTSSDAISLANADKLPVFITATCSFGWWDIDDLNSGAEALLLNPGGGAVAMFTTVRLVYTSASPNDLNPGLNRALNIALFERDAAGRPVRFGDAMVETKNTGVGLLGNSRKFNLLGDPSMRIGLPSKGVAIDKINDVEVGGTPGQMRALDRVRVEGSVHTASGNTDSGFDGTVTLTVFDSERRVPINKYRWMPNPYYEVREDLLWRGDVKVTGGLFAAEFVVPKDISYSNDPGRITAYARAASDQALGFTENFLVGGTSDNPPDDGAGPQISLFLNDTTFVSGGLAGADAELIAILGDESGINTVGSGVGHEMLLVLNQQETQAVDISSSFVSDENSYQRGTVKWKLTDLPNGPNRLTVRAWDVLNNSTTAELEFFVLETEDLTIRNVYNYPNPMSSRTRFLFEHNQPPGTPAKVQIRIYTLNGRPIRTITSDEALPTGTLTAGPVRVEWDGRDEDFDRIATGIYLYKVRVEVDTSGGDRQVVERVEKVAVIR